MRVYPIFSPEDADLAEWAWFNPRQANNPYARRTVTGHCPSGQTGIYAHREVMARIQGRELARPEIVDHINHQGLDCRRENLRLTDRLGNRQNLKPYPGRGASPHRIPGKWVAQCGHRGRNIYLGIFNTREEAAAAARKKRVELGFLGEPTAINS